MEDLRDFSSSATLDSKLLDFLLHIWKERAVEAERAAARAKVMVAVNVKNFEDWEEAMGIYVCLSVSLTLS